jgi:excisionase family DNA binding protein
MVQGEGRVFYTPAEAADRLRMGRTRLYELIARGEIRAIRLGPRMIRIPVAALDEWLESLQTSALTHR